MGDSFTGQYDFTLAGVLGRFNDLSWGGGGRLFFITAAPLIDLK